MKYRKSSEEVRVSMIAICDFRGMVLEKLFVLEFYRKEEKHSTDEVISKFKIIKN